MFTLVTFRYRWVAQNWHILELLGQFDIYLMILRYLPLVQYYSDMIAVQRHLTWIIQVDDSDKKMSSFSTLIVLFSLSAAKVNNDSGCIQ